MIALAQGEPVRPGRAAPQAARPRRPTGRSSWPAVVVVGAVIVFPWAFTIWMSLHEWKVGGAHSFVGLTNYARLSRDRALPRGGLATPLCYTLLAVRPAAGPRARSPRSSSIASFPLRGVLRGIFVMPMMATPVAIALVWTMMFHPQLGVLNYLLSLVGIPPQAWMFHPATRDSRRWCWSRPGSGRRSSC